MEKVFDEIHKLIVSNTSGNVTVNLYKNISYLIAYTTEQEPVIYLCKMKHGILFPFTHKQLLYLRLNDFNFISDCSVSKFY